MYLRQLYQYLVQHLAGVFSNAPDREHEMATLYTVQTAGILHAELTLDEAASLLGVDPLELEWAIEEDGICSTVDDQGNDVVAVAERDEWRLK